MSPFKTVSLKLLFAVPMLLAVGVGCAPPSDEDSDSADQRVTATSGSAPSSIAACQGKEPCVQAFVLRTILASDLKLTGAPTESGAPISAAEYVMGTIAVQKAAATPEGSGASGSTLRIDTSAAPGGKTKVKFTIHSISFVDGSPEMFESAAWFTFTIDGSAIVERSVELGLAG